MLALLKYVCFHTGRVFGSEMHPGLLSGICTVKIPLMPFALLPVY